MLIPIVLAFHYMKRRMFAEAMKFIAELRDVVSKPVVIGTVDVWGAGNVYSSLLESILAVQNVAIDVVNWEDPSRHAPDIILSLECTLEAIRTTDWKDPFELFTFQEIEAILTTHLALLLLWKGQTNGINALRNANGRIFHSELSFALRYWNLEIQARFELLVGHPKYAQVILSEMIRFLEEKPHLFYKLRQERLFLLYER